MAIGRPPHRFDDRSIPVVDHLLEPDALVEHPDDDEAVLVGRREFPVISVPRRTHNRPLVALERLVHREVRRRRDPLRLRVRPGLGLQLQDLQEPVLPPARDPPRLRVPRQSVELYPVRDGDLLGEVDEHDGEQGERKPI